MRVTLLVFMSLIARIASAQTPAPYPCPTAPDPSAVQANAAKLLSTGMCQNCMLIGAQLAGSDLSSAQLMGADLTCADLTNAVLAYGNLSSAKLIHATLQGTDMSGTTLNCTDFSNADITAVKFGNQFGLYPVVSADMNCRTSFRYGVVDVSFFSLQQIRYLNLDHATLKNQTALSSNSYKNFSYAVMPGVDLSGVDFTGTNWQGADLSSTTLNGAIFSNAVLTNADLSYASASKVKFDGAHFETDQTHNIAAAVVANAYLADATFDNAVLSYANFNNTTLTGPNASMRNAILTGTSFVGANLSGMSIGDAASAQGVNFSGANLSNASLKNLNSSYNQFVAKDTTTLQRSTFTNTFLWGATIDSTNLTCADLTNAYVLSKPQNYTPPGGAPVSINGTTIVNPVTENVRNMCNTICPDGSVGPCTGDTRWNYGAVPSVQCCVVDPSNPKPCPNRKKTNAACTSDCDCSSKKCSSGYCAAQ